MPRFLAVDYFAEAVQKHRALLNRMLLAVPQHLDQIEKYAHSGTVPDEAYRRPWVRACANQKQLQLDDANLLADVTTLAGKAASQLESFVSDHLLCYNEFGGTYEMVPSSNPESQNSVEDEVLRRLADETELVWDNFEQIGLVELHSNTEKGDGWLLEEVSSADYLAGFACQMPPLDSMIKRLKPKMIKDPFVMDSGDHISEVHLLRCDLIYSNNTEHKHRETDCDDTVIYEKETLLHIEDELLDEELVPSTSVDAERTQQTAVTLCDPDLELQKLLTKLQQERLTEAVKEPSQDLEKLLSQEGLVARLKEPEKIAVSPVDNTDVSFTQLNEQGLQEKRDLNTSMLESPANISVISSPYPRIDPWKDLQSLDITAFQDSCFMSPDKKQALLKQFWQREKYFSEILTLRLQEPEIEATHERALPSHAMRVLRLKCEDCSGNLELDLTWDPTVGFTRSMAHWLAADRRLEWTNDETSDVGPVEVYELYNMAMQDMQDEEISGPTYTYDERKKHECIDTGIPPIKKGVISKPLVGQNKDTSEKTKEIFPPVVEDPLDQFILLRGGPVSNDSWTGPVAEPAARNGTAATAAATCCQPPKPIEGLKQPSTPTILGTPGTPSREGRRRSKCKIIQVQLTDEFLDIRRTLQEAAQPFLSLLKQGSHIPQSHDFTAFTPDVTKFILKQHEKSRSDSLAEISDICVEVYQAVIVLSHVLQIVTLVWRCTKLSLSCLVSYNSDTCVEVYRAIIVLSRVLQIVTLVWRCTKLSLSCVMSYNSDTCTEVYQAVIVLHCLVSAADVLLHGCLQAAIVQLSSLQVKHQSLLKGQLEGVRQHLFRLQCAHQETHTQHPKLLVMARNIAEWLVRKKRKSPGHDPKILILSRRDMSSLLESIAESASLVAGVNPCVQQQATCHAVLDSVEKHNCLVLTAARLASDFPWAQFSLVIEQHIRFIGLEMLMMGATLQRSFEDSFATMKQTPVQAAGAFVFIGSHRLTGYTQVLQLLETRHNIMILERDYRALQRDTGLHFADVVLDERNCIVLHNLASLTGTQRVEPLVAMATALGVKYEMCWLVLFSQNSSGTTQYPYAGCAVSNIAKLQAAVSLFSFKTDAYKVKVLLCASEAETAAMIRQIGDVVCDSTRVWQQEEWINRPWLAPELSQHEKLLLMFPCFNSFSAQVLLTRAPLKSLLTVSAEELAQLCPWLPQKTIQLFYHFTHWKSGLQAEHRTAKAPANTDPVFLSSSHNYDRVATESLHGKPAMEMDSVEQTCIMSPGSRVWNVADERMLRSDTYPRKRPEQPGLVHEDDTTELIGATDITDLYSDSPEQGFKVKLNAVNDTAGFILEENSPNQTVPTWYPDYRSNTNRSDKTPDRDGLREMPNEYEMASMVHCRPSEFSIGQMDTDHIKEQDRPFGYSTTEPSQQHVYISTDVSSPIYRDQSVNIPTKNIEKAMSCYDPQQYDMNPAVANKPVVLQSPLEFIMGHAGRCNPVTLAKKEDTGLVAGVNRSMELQVADHPEQRYVNTMKPQDQNQNLFAKQIRQNLAHKEQNKRSMQDDTNEFVQDLATRNKQLVFGKDTAVENKQSVFPSSLAKTAFQTASSRNSEAANGQSYARAVRSESAEAPGCGEYRNYEGIRRVKLWTEFGDVHHVRGRSTCRIGGNTASFTQPVRSSPWNTGTTPGRAQAVMTPLNTRHLSLTSGEVSKTPARRSSTPNRTPNIAPVTPCIRRPVQALKLGEEGGNGMPQAVNASTKDSPPMDLDSEDEDVTSVCRQQFQCKPWQRLENMHPSQDPRICQSIKGFEKIKGFEETNATSLFHPWHPGVVSLTPSKKRRLTFETVPGHKGGQTRLTFL
ncbi:hypothetical protein LSAT2_016788 [Lamellibrachia satsuma]|nr:hypothetical protein LSAT2_016788 [Lamellibrachia satsuma]